MTDTYITYQYESYAIFANTDPSILLLNPLIEPYGFTFKIFDLQKLYEDFSAVFGIAKDEAPKALTTLQNFNITTSLEFCQAIQGTPGFGLDVVMRNQLCMLKIIEPSTQEVINNSVNTTLLMRVFKKLTDFTDTLLLQLRLLKTGDIYSPFPFQIASVTRNILSRMASAPVHNGTQLFSLTESDVEKFKASFRLTFEATPLVSLAMGHFQMAYQIKDPRIRFITLMTALESIFNVGSEQITHIVSRHLAMVTSSNAVEFEKAYKENKKLYGHRSQIVHGTGKGNNDPALLEELENKLRTAIRYCMEQHSDKDKKELFTYLNSSGF